MIATTYEELYDVDNYFDCYKLAKIKNIDIPIHYVLVQSGANLSMMATHLGRLNNTLPSFCLHKSWIRIGCFKEDMNKIAAELEDYIDSSYDMLITYPMLKNERPKSLIDLLKK